MKHGETHREAALAKIESDQEAMNAIETLNRLGYEPHEVVVAMVYLEARPLPPKPEEC